jgi:hypothetical protein
VRRTEGRDGVETLLIGMQQQDIRSVFFRHSRALRVRLSPCFWVETLQHVPGVGAHRPDSRRCFTRRQAQPGAMRARLPSWRTRPYCEAAW